MKPVYFDYAASTPVDDRVLKVMDEYQRQHFGNPGSLHRLGRAANRTLEDARARVAKVLGAKRSEIVFTSGSTETANLAILGVATRFPDAGFVTLKIEHEAVLQPLASLEGCKVVRVDTGGEGVVRADEIAAAIDNATVLVAVQYANNEIGAVQPIAKIGAEIARIRQSRKAAGNVLPLYLYCDAAQAGLLSLQVARLEVDLMSMGGSKLYGPPGSGFLYVRTGTELLPVIHGGGQESGLRSGTQNVAAALGLARALELVQQDRQEESRRQARLRDDLWQRLQRTEGLRVNGSLKTRLPGNLNFLVEGASGEALVSHLDAAGFAVATGSACTAANEEPSHVLLAIGRTPKQAESSLRITLGRPTTAAEVEALATALEHAIRRVRELQ